MNQTIAANRPLDTYTSFKRQRRSAGVISCLVVLFVWSVCTVGIVACFPQLAHAQDEIGTEYEPGVGVLVGPGLTVPFGVERRFETDIDDGGEVDEWRLHVGTGVRITLSRQWQAAFNVNYMYNRYDFSGSTGLWRSRSVGAPELHLHHNPIDVYSLEALEFQGLADFSHQCRVRGGHL